MIVIGQARKPIKILEVSGGIGQVVMDSSTFNESDHPRDNDGKFGSGGGGGTQPNATAAVPRNLGSLKAHPSEKMREYTPKELDWEYEVEYKKYSQPVFPNAFHSREDFQKKYDAAPLVALSDTELKSLGNSMAASGLGKNENWVHATFSHRRDSARILKDMKEGRTAPPIVLKHGNKLRLMAGQTRLAAGAALGISVPTKVIDVTASLAKDSSAAFKESEHPRDKDGKFSTGGGGGGSAGGIGGHPGANVPAPLTNHLKSIVKNAGFKKAKGNGLTTYVHPSGVKIIVHPTPGKIHSSKWSVMTKENSNGPEPGHSGSGTSLSNVLAKLVPKGATPKPTNQPGEGFNTTPYGTPSLVPPSNSASKEKVVNALSVVGFNHKDVYTDDDGSKYQIFEASSGDEVKYNVETGDWMFSNGDDDLSELDKEDGFGMQEGKGLTHLLAMINGEEPENQAIAEKASSLEVMKNSASGKSITGLGYEPAEIDGESTIYTKPNGAKIKYNSATTAWVAVTPGHMTKEGNGLPDLELLMGGSKPANVKNSSATITTKAEASKQTEAQKAAEAKQAAYEKNVSNQQKLMKELQAAAPQASATEQEAINYYSGGNYSTINNELRHNPENADNNNKVKAIDAYLNKSVIPKDVTLYRKVSNDYAKILKSVIMEGCSFIDRGFISTSTHEETWSGSLKMVINVPAGSKGAAIKQYSQHKSENEVLLPRNSKLVVTAMDLKTSTIHVTLDQGHFGK